MNLWHIPLFSSRGNKKYLRLFAFTTTKQKDFNHLIDFTLFINGILIAAAASSFRIEVVKFNFLLPLLQHYEVHIIQIMQFKALIIRYSSGPL